MAGGGPQEGRAEQGDEREREGGRQKAGQLFFFPPFNGSFSLPPSPGALPPGLSGPHSRAQSLPFYFTRLSAR